MKLSPISFKKCYFFLQLSTEVIFTQVHSSLTSLQIMLDILQDLVFKASWPGILQAYILHESPLNKIWPQDEMTWFFSPSCCKLNLDLLAKVQFFRWFTNTNQALSTLGIQLSFNLCYTLPQQKFCTQMNLILWFWKQPKSMPLIYSTQIF